MCWSESQTNETVKALIFGFQINYRAGLTKNRFTDCGRDHAKRAARISGIVNLWNRPKNNSPPSEIIETSSSKTPPESPRPSESRRRHLPDGLRAKEKQPANRPAKFWS